jgi:aminoglycoside/choline kinase family phosphotransferase
MNRTEAMLAWLDSACGIPAAQLEPASSDASFRRYFRLQLAAGTRIVMDAPPPQENCRPFVAIATVLRDGGLHAPEVHAADLEQGFLLLEDLGPTTYLDALGTQAADPLYRSALQALCRMQQIAAPDHLPVFDAAFMRRELDLFPEWYLDRHLQRPLSPEDRAIWVRATTALIAGCAAQPQVLVHRDFHSRNLMVCADGPGILDFQDAVRGPITYDAASLLRDAYVGFDEAQQLDWLVRWWEGARAAGLPVAGDFGLLYRDFEWMAAQRLFKIAGIFARLHHRDGKSAYLASLPRVLGGLQTLCERYAELRPLSRLLASSHDALTEGLSF